MDEPRRRRRRGPIIALSIVAVLLAGVAIAGFAFTNYLSGCRTTTGTQEPVSFTVPEGASGSEVVDSLVEEGILKCAAVVRWDLKKRGLSSSFRAGDYDLTTNMTLDDALAAFEGPQEVKTVSVTLPEGWTVEQMIPELSRSLKVPPGELRAEIERGRTLAPYLPGGKPLEGFLFPKTYEFPKAGLNARQVVDTLVEQFEEEVGSLPWKNAKRLGITPYEAVVIASMIERETMVASERTKVSAVIHNRLEMREPLGIDATLVYIDPDPSNGLTASDLEIDSPYNTRTTWGLPPTPIANPGLASIKAALTPANTDVWLYVLCGDDGRHAFTNDYGEFQSLKAKCL